jgi:hypothetical protein
MDHVLKKIGLVAVATIGLSLAATPAFATPADHSAPRDVTPYVVSDPVTYGQAINLFTDGGQALGYGLAAAIAGAYSGIATTPSLISHSFTCGAGC